ncbi:unnamed protein product [Cuscuta epithymum]|uniref:CCHC-type domain-containing protein n=1 Tax=Cuscuta epithymum TaxID=186058 RepID=A0AAV0CCK8_9ASTE|nr:unnamed protein product [Cuscuta epithymum]
MLEKQARRRQRVFIRRLVGRILTDRPVKFTAFKETMANAWRPGKGVSMRDLGGQKFLVQFYHKYDLCRVLDDGPWSFDRNLLLPKRLGSFESSNQCTLTQATFMIQVHNIPLNLMTSYVAELIGNYVGIFVSVDENNYKGPVKVFMRVHVLVDIANPLKQMMKLRRGKEWVWIEFWYERLPTFCYICGRLGHSDRFCPGHVGERGSDLSRSYGVCLVGGGYFLKKRKVMGMKVVMGFGLCRFF